MIEYLILLHLGLLLLSWVSGRYILSLNSPRSNSLVEDHPLFMIVEPFIPIINLTFIVIAAIELFIKISEHFQSWDTESVKRFYMFDKKDKV